MKKKSKKKSKKKNITAGCSSDLSSIYPESCANLELPKMSAILFYSEWEQYYRNVFRMADFIKQVNEALTDKSKGGTPLNVNETGWLLESKRILKLLNK